MTSKYSDDCSVALVLSECRQQAISIHGFPIGVLTSGTQAGDVYKGLKVWHSYQYC